MKNKPLILLVEDDNNLNNINRRVLEKEGYSVNSALTLSSAWELLEKQIPDLILLDIKMPDGSGFDFCKEVRKKQKFTAVPVLFLTAVTDDEGELEGLLSGGNDYLRKPYDIEMLRIRVDNMLKLRDSQIKQIITRGPLTLNKNSNRAYLHEEDMLLKPKEFLLLLIFVINEGCVMDAQHLYKLIWELPKNNDNRTLKKHISCLRKKLEKGKSGFSISAIYGKGYCFKEIGN